MHAAPLVRALGEEELIALGEVPGILPKKKGRAISMGTLYRWALAGLAGVGPLETTRVGRELYTTREALVRFLGRVDETRRGGRRRVQAPTAGPDRATREAIEELRSLGM